MSPASSPCGPAPCSPAPYEHPVTGPLPARGGPPPLLGPDDPPPFSILNPDGRAPFVLVCDHASPAVPASLGTLGLEREQFARHIAYDIGAAAVTRLLSARFDAPAVLSGFSRLVIDPNRALDDPTAIPVVSDGVVVPGNRAIDAEEIGRRTEAIFTPYQEAVARTLASKRVGGAVPALVSIHSFTPVMRGVARPWHVGVLWDADGRIARPLIAALRTDGRWCVGDNEPYSGVGTPGGTVETHAYPAGLPNVLIEVRQDLIADEAGAALWAEVLAAALAPILAAPDLYRAEIRPRRLTA